MAPVWSLLTSRVRSPARAARYWSSKTAYATANGGEFPFLIDSRSGFALPASAAFWDALFARARAWGLEVFEQDWLNWQTDHFAPLLHNASLGESWFRQMGDAAKRNGVSIQLCMAYSRHVMQSVVSPSFTQVRGSGDYRAGNDLWAPLGATGLFAYALGLAPSKVTTTRNPPHLPPSMTFPSASLSPLLALILTYIIGHLLEHARPEGQPVGPTDAGAIQPASGNCRHAHTWAGLPLRRPRTRQHTADTPFSGRRRHIAAPRTASDYH